MSTFTFELPTGEAAAAATVAADGVSIDHATDAVARLIQRFRKPKMTAVVRLLGESIQPLEDAIAAVLLTLNANDAEGWLLDLIGKLVGQARNGQPDVTYRRFIRARVRSNRSSGNARDVLAVARLVVGDDAATFEIDERGLADFRLTVDGVVVAPDDATVLAAFVRASVAAGVRGVVEYLPSLPADSFTFEGFVPGSEAGEGFESFDGLSGGDLGGAIE